MEIDCARALRVGADAEGARFLAGDTEDVDTLFCLAGVVRTTERAEVTEVDCSGLCIVGNAEGGAVIRRSAFDNDCIVLVVFFREEVGTGTGTCEALVERDRLISPFLFGGTIVVTPLISLASEAVEYARGLFDVVDRLEIREAVSEGGFEAIRGDL